MRFRSVIFLLLFASGVFSQKPNDTLEIINLYKQSEKLIDTNTDSALIYANRTLTLSEKIKYTSGYLQAIADIGLAYRNQSKYPEAESTFKKGLAIASKEKREDFEAAFYKHIGMLNEFQGNYGIALENLMTSLKLYEKLNDEGGKGRLLNSIAMVFAENGNNEKAIEYYRESIKIKLKNGDTLASAHGHNNIAIVLIDLKRYDEAIAETKISYEINKKYGAKKEMAYNIGNLGYAYDEKGDKQKAKEYYNRSIAMMDKLSVDDGHIAIPLNSLGTIYFDENNFTEAEKLFKRSLSIAEKADSKEDMRDAYGNLSRLYAKKKQFDLAYKYEQQFNVLADTLAKIKADEALAEKMVKFDTERKEKDNELLKEQNRIQELKLQRRSYVIAGLSIIVCLIIITGILLFRIRNLKARQEKVIVEQKLLRSQMNPHFVFNAINGIQSRILQQKQHEAYNYLTKFSQLIRLFLVNTNEDAVPLSKEIEAIKLYIELEQMRFGEKFEFTMTIDKNVDIENTLIPSMLIQPFLENAIWHGLMPLNGEHTGKLLLNIKEENGHISVIVEDNGIGRKRSAEINKNLNHKSLGIALTQQRLELVAEQGSKISIEDIIAADGSGEGTRVRITV